MAQKKNKQKNSVRIISGIWRSRRIQFLDQAHIRPTPDRVRETIFNWLGKHISGARCLDLFAGSGALGFEAASRGAEQVILVDMDSSISKMLDEQKMLFSASQIEVVQQDALTYLQQTSHTYDVVFIDPPFDSNVYQTVLSTLLLRQLITKHSMLYIESSSQLPAMQTELMDRHKLTCIREKTAGEVHFGLYRASDT